MDPVRFSAYREMRRVALIAITSLGCCSVAAAADLYPSPVAVPVAAPGPPESPRITIIEENDAFGCFNAATIYASGLGVEPDLETAARLYDTACEAEDGESCYELALLYEEGKGVGRDAARAEELRRRACRFGFQKSCR